jgi:hypothetical protein
MVAWCAACAGLMMIATGWPAWVAGVATLVASLIVVGVGAATYYFAIVGLELYRWRRWCLRSGLELPSEDVRDAATLRSTP